ncbi:UDPglucose 6-dehydrogenase [Bacillus sp. SORGH_AS 510]|uniref:UDP-glucose dehydrogenase family protein n=1 Tax=Bacillus sp. SORGH_AS_0510 TaxID=3041771 RepID=UPI00277E2E00|nr:nucleotide sugar dehydrogenase [Bacillus sp. SORGH_AS_0510]MDQ1147904.1 UDPglucose 6-dehydrogenase [Bacillus sp. SORGH_AS_0510]
MRYTITVIGLGFVGLTTALAFAEKNNCVYGIDINPDRLDTIRSGNLPFAEPGLDQALLRHNNNNFSVTTDVKTAVKNSEFVFLCVGTPAGEKGETDLTYIFSAIDHISSVLHDGKYRVIVIKSTVPPSTTLERVIPYLQKKGLSVGERFSVANNPEFLREGKCWEDMMNADRIVCGVCDQKGESMLRSLYSRFSSPFFSVSLNTGEFIKYLSNTLLATMISYANEMSKAADAIGDVQTKEAFQILHMDRRWGGCEMKNYVYPGCGYGGYCLPKDTQAMYAQAFSNGYEPTILKHVISVNETMPQYMVDKIIRITELSDTIGILGLSFKPDSDDVRDSSSAKIISLLLQSGYNNLFAFDPLANKAFAKEYEFEQISYCDSLEEIYRKSKVLVLVTAWKEFASLDKDDPNKTILDFRYFL